MSNFIHAIVSIVYAFEKGGRVITRDSDYEKKFPKTMNPER